MERGLFKYSNKTKTRESLPIAIYNSGVQQCAPGYTWGPGLRDHFLIHHVISGKGVFTASGATYSVGAGDTFLIYPSEMVSYTADRQEPWEYCWVGFQGAQAKLLLSQTTFSEETPVTHFENTQQMQDAILAIYHAIGSAPASELRAIGLLYVFLALLVEQKKGLPSAEDPSLEYVENAVRFIAHNYSRTVDTTDIAVNVGISRSHLYRVFMKHLDTPPNEYLTRFRISQACELLEHSALPISAIAASVGYEDQLYFSRVFKKITGKPPSLYSRGEKKIILTKERT